MTSVHSLGTSTSDVQNPSDVQRQSLQSDVESSSIRDTESHEVTGSVGEDSMDRLNMTLYNTGLLRRSYGELITLVELCDESEFGLFKSITDYHNLGSMEDDTWGKCEDCGKEMTFYDIKEYLVERMTRLLGMDSRVPVSEVCGDCLPYGLQPDDMEFYRKDGIQSDDIIWCEFEELRDQLLSLYPPDSVDSSDFYSFMWKLFYDDDHWCEVMDLSERVSESKCDDGDEDGVREEFDEFMCNPEYHTEFREYLYRVMKEEHHPQVLMMMIGYHQNTLTRVESDDSVVIN